MHLLDFIPGNLDIEERLKLDDLDLPLEEINDLKKSSLSYHLITEEEPEDIVSIWNEITKCQTLIRFEEENEEWLEMI